MKIRASIIMPVKNGENYIEESLESVILNTLESDEIIIIDDGSEDKTLTIIDELMGIHKRIILFKGNNLLPSGARNIGLKYARGEFVTFIDHDDLWPPYRLKHHISILNESPKTDVVRGKVLYFSDDQLKLTEFDFLSEDNTVYQVNLGSFTFRKIVFEHIGFFNETLKFGEDVDLFFRLNESQIQIYNDELISLKYRIHDNNMTHNKAENNKRVFFKLLAMSIKRRRDSNNTSNIKSFVGVDYGK
jgi:glycosyltransferase involved in cell wall biosynthesis